MPSYDFSCQTCGLVFEKSIPYNGEMLHVRCPAGHEHARQVYTAPQVVFKGNGWYSTDHRSPDKDSGSAQITTS